MQAQIARGNVSDRGQFATTVVPIKDILSTLAAEGVTDNRLAMVRFHHGLGQAELVMARGMMEPGSSRIQLAGDVPEFSSLTKIGELQLFESPTHQILSGGRAKLLHTVNELLKMKSEDGQLTRGVYLATSVNRTVHQQYIRVGTSPHVVEGIRSIRPCMRSRALFGLKLGEGDTCTEVVSLTGADIHEPDAIMDPFRWRTEAATDGSMVSLSKPRILRGGEIDFLVNFRHSACRRLTLAPKGMGFTAEWSRDIPCDSTVIGAISGRLPLVVGCTPHRGSVEISIHRPEKNAFAGFVS